MFSARRTDQVDFFFNGNGSAFENNLDSGRLLQALLRDVQRQCCWKRGSGDGQRLWDYGTTERSFILRFRIVRYPWKASFDAHLDRLRMQGHRRQLIAKSGKLYVSISRQRWIVKRRRYMPAPVVELHLCLRGGTRLGEEGRFDVAARSDTPKPSCQNRCDRAVSQVKGHIPKQRSEKTASAEPISKKGIKLVTKTIGNRKKGECVKFFEVTSTTGENLQIARHKSVQCAECDLCVAICSFS